MLRFWRIIKPYAIGANCWPCLERFGKKHYKDTQFHQSTLLQIVHQMHAPLSEVNPQFATSMYGVHQIYFIAWELFLKKKQWTDLLAFRSK